MSREGDSSPVAAPRCRIVPISAIDHRSQTPRDALTWAVEVLRGLDMPSVEIEAIVAADQPVIVYRYFELHRERLEEQLADQLWTLQRLERVLTQAIVEAAPRPHADVPRAKSVGRCAKVDPAIRPASEGR